MDQDRTIVIFRTPRSGEFEGDVTAVFPELPATRWGDEMPAWLAAHPDDDRRAGP